MDDEYNEKRFNRLEEKIDKLSEAMVSIARAEEKLIAMETKYGAQYDRLNRFSEKLDRLEKTVDDNTRVTQGISRFFWLFATAIVGALVTQYFMVIK